MVHFVALVAALGAAASGAPASPIPTATPEIAKRPTPIATDGLVLPAVPVQQTAPPNVAPPSGDIVGNAQPFVGLALPDAIGMALARNTDLAVSQSNRRIAAYRIVEALGRYDLQLQLRPSYEFSQQAAISSFNSGPNGTPLQTVTAGADLGVTALTGSGGRLQADTSAQRVDNNLSVDSYDPYYQTAFALTYTQPLARGRAIDENRERISIARINADLSGDNARVTASNTIDNVSIAYDNLVSAWKSVAIGEDALRQARAQSESNGRLVRRGRAAPVDVVESNEQVEAFQDQVFSAIQNVASAQNNLKTLLLSDPADPVWTANLVPTTPVGAVSPEPSLDEVVVRALAARPEVGQIRENLRSQAVTIAYEKDQTKPQIDLSVGVTENGFAGALLPPTNNPISSIIGAQIAAINGLIARANAGAAPGTPPLVPLSAGGLNTPPYPGSVGKLGTAYKSALNGQYPVYQISATLAFPLRNRTAEANYGEAVEQRRQLLTQELGLIQRLQSESRNGLQQYRSSRSRLIAATAARSAAQRVADSEVRKFRAGESTTFLVLQREVTLANARGRELQAQTDVQNALVELDRVTGDILTKNNVDITTLGTGPQGAVPNLVPSPSSKP